MAQQKSSSSGKQPPPTTPSLQTGQTPLPFKKQEQPLVLSSGTLSPPCSPRKLIVYDGTLYEFPRQPPQKFICSICTQLVKDPHLTACCGQEFCETCLEQWETMSKNTTCPHCRQERFVHILNKQSRREVEEMDVYCSKKQNGCDWKGSLKVVEAHQKNCDFTLVKCLNCSMFIPRKDYEDHTTSNCPYRDSKCIYCNREDAYLKVISFVHLAECPGYPMGCPNNCGAVDIKRSEMQTHKEECPLEEIDCPMKSAGCLVGKIQRKLLGSHIEENQPRHLLFLLTSFERTQQQLEEQQRELRELKVFKITTSHAMEEMVTTVNKLSEKALTTQLTPLRSISALLSNSKSLLLDSDNTKLTLLVPNLSELEKKKVPSWTSPPFFLGPGYKVCLVLQKPTGFSADITAELRLLCGEFDHQLKWPCTVDLSNIYVSLAQNEKLLGRKIMTAPKKAPPPPQPFSLSSKGDCYPAVTRCVDVGPESHRLLWETDKLMEPLPPFPSTLRSQYIHNDCLAITLTWGQVASGLNTSFLNLSLSKGAKSVSVPKFGLTVTTSTTTGQVSAAILRRKSRKLTE